MIDCRGDAGYADSVGTVSVTSNGYWGVYICYNAISRPPTERENKSSWKRLMKIFESDQTVSEDIEKRETPAVGLHLSPENVKSIKLNLPLRGNVHMLIDLMRNGIE